MPIPPPYDGEMARPPATGLNWTDGTSKTIVKWLWPSTFLSMQTLSQKRL